MHFCIRIVSNDDKSDDKPLSKDLWFYGRRHLKVKNGGYLGHAGRNGLEMFYGHIEPIAKEQK